MVAQRERGAAAACGARSSTQQALGRGQEVSRRQRACATRAGGSTAGGAPALRGAPRHPAAAPDGGQLRVADEHGRAFGADHRRAPRVPGRDQESTEQVARGHGGQPERRLAEEVDAWEGDRRERRVRHGDRSRRRRPCGVRCPRTNGAGPSVPGHAGDEISSPGRPHTPTAGDGPAAALRWLDEDRCTKALDRWVQGHRREAPAERRLCCGSAGASPDARDRRTMTSAVVAGPLLRRPTALFRERLPQKPVSRRRAPPLTAG